MAALVATWRDSPSSANNPCRPSRCARATPPSPPPKRQRNSRRLVWTVSGKAPRSLSAHWDHERTPNPSRGGESMSGTLAEFPSWEGPGVGRFMERAFAWRSVHKHELVAIKNQPAKVRQPVFFRIGGQLLRLCRRRRTTQG